MEPSREGEILSSALQLPQSHREDYVRHVCAGDAQLSHEVLNRLRRIDEESSLVAAPSRPAALPERFGTHSEPVESAPRAEQPTQMGEYVLLDLLGEGGMGRVYRARHRRMNRIVALKTVSPQVLGTRAAVERFQREIQVAAQLVHPNIITAYDAGEAEGVPFLVMEFVDGRNLARVVKRDGPLPWRKAVDYVLQAAHGLKYAHDRGIIHRDIKPGNLLVDSEGTVRILDMGLARATGLAGAPSLTRSGDIMGTVAFASPEQLENSHRVDHRTDVYSLGCTLYCLLTAQLPIPIETAVEVLSGDRTARTSASGAVRARIPRHLAAVCCRMVARQPQDRPAAMGDVINALEDCLHRRSPQFLRSFLRRMQVWARRS